MLHSHTLQGILAGALLAMVLLPTAVHAQEKTAETTSDDAVYVRPVVAHPGVLAIELPLQDPAAAMGASHRPTNAEPSNSFSVTLDCSGISFIRCFAFTDDINNHYYYYDWTPPCDQYDGYHTYKCEFTCTGAKDSPCVTVTKPNGETSSACRTVYCPSKRLRRGTSVSQ